MKPIEFTSGIQGAIKYLVGGSSVTLAIVCVLVITGASLELAAVDAIVEPCINGVWFWFLHNSWKKYAITK